ncbi:unnamed protein product [Prorocentrum cordatum]|uniref:NmrA-like domain-containing protein n=1 Tax=Prorocentrum cordatum TaxID=2364126 RepID=A0ABN9QLS7_9DINO|nr:unnamed protein product [Polarella glacialis]
MSKPTVAIIAATGQTGKWALKGALQREYPVRVLVRSTDKLKKVLQDLLPEKTEEAVSEMLEKDITVVESPALEQTKLVELFTGADVAMSFLGMGPDKQPIVASGARKIVDALRSMDSPPKYLHIRDHLAQRRRKARAESLGLLRGGASAQGVPEGVLRRPASGRGRDRRRPGRTAVRGLRGEAPESDNDPSDDPRRQSGEEKVLILLPLPRFRLFCPHGRSSSPRPGSVPLASPDKKDYLKDFTAGDKSYKLVKVGGEKTSGKLSFQIDRQHVAEAFLDVARDFDYDGENVSVFEK